MRAADGGDGAKLVLKFSPMRKLLILTLWLAVLATPGFSQTGAGQSNPAQAKAAAGPACDGTLAMVRVSEIKPGGTMKGFLAAVAAHKAWYRANGITDNEIFAARVLVKDEKTGVWANSEKQVLTYHLNTPDPARTPKRGDEAWKAYVKMYQDNSEIKSEYLTCMPKQK